MVTKIKYSTHVYGHNRSIIKTESTKDGYRAEKLTSLK